MRYATRLRLRLQIFAKKSAIIAPHKFSILHRRLASTEKIDLTFKSTHSSIKTTTKSRYIYYISSERALLSQNKL